MSWLRGVGALAATGEPRGLSWQERRRLRRFARRTGLVRALAAWQRARLLGGADLARCRELLARNADRELLFIVSYHKTGTRSVHEYLERIGLRGLHWPVFVNCGIDYQTILEPWVGDPDRCVAALAPVLAAYDFFGDVPFPGLYAELAERLPRSRFVVVERDPDAWWRSVSRHWNLPAGDRVLGALEAIQYRWPLGTVVGTADREKLLRRYGEHLAAVDRDLGDTGRLLRVKLDDPDIGRALSDFVGVAEQPAFPHVRSGAVHRPAKTAS
jgi:hypothetical protein